MEFSSTEGNLEADSDISLILSTYFEVADIEKLVEEIERLDLDMPVLVIDGCERSVSSVLYH
jgi:hypothetical protein